MPAANSSHYVLILAGGSGTRFWPLSRNERLKQQLDIFDDTTLLGVDDLIVVQTDDAVLGANRHQTDAIKQLVKNLPEELL